MASPSDTLTDIPEDAKAHPEGYAGGDDKKGTGSGGNGGDEKPQEPFSITSTNLSAGGFRYGDPISHPVVQGDGQGNDDDKDNKDKKDDTGAGGSGGDEPPSGSDDVDADDCHEEEEEEEEDDETSSDDAPPVQAPVPPQNGAIQTLGVNPQGLIVVNFRIAFANEMYNVKCHPKTTFAQARNALFAQYLVQTNARGNIRFLDNIGVQITSTGTTLRNLGIVDGYVIDVVFGGAGGGGKRKVDDDNTPVFLAPVVEQNDTDAVQKALQLKSIYLEGWADGLPLPVLTSIYDEVEKINKTGSVSTLIAPYLKHIGEFSELQKAEERHLLVKRYIKALFADTFVKYADGGAWKAHLKFKQYIRDAKIRAETKSSGSAKPEDMKVD